MESRERARLLRLRKAESETRRRGNHPRRRVLLSAATRREGRYRCGQLKPFRLLLTEAAIACPHQVGQTTWTRQLVTSSFSVRLWAEHRRARRPAVRFPAPSLEAWSGPGQVRPTPTYRSVGARSREVLHWPALGINQSFPTRYSRTQALRYDHWNSHALASTAITIHRPPHTTVSIPVSSLSMAASERRSGRSITSLLMSRMA